MKLFFVSIGLLVLTGCASIKKELVWASLPGARVEGQCDPYARSLTAALQRRHVEAYLVYFDWTQENYHGAHAVCIFRDATGGLSWVDNMNPEPHRLQPAKSMLGLVHQITPAATRVWSNSKLPL